MQNVVCYLTKQQTNRKKMNKIELKEKFNKYKLNRIWTYLEPKLKNSIHITPKITNEESIDIGKSKIGGSPDLPKDFEWFEFK